MGAACLQARIHPQRTKALVRRLFNELNRDSRELPILPAEQLNIMARPSRLAPRVLTQMSDGSTGLHGAEDLSHAGGFLDIFARTRAFLISVSYVSIHDLHGSHMAMHWWFQT